MKLENQVTSLELSRILKKLGVKQESLFYYQISDTTPELRHGKTTTNYGVPVQEWYSAYTVAELGELLPFQVSTIKTKTRWLCRMIFDNNPFRKEKGATYVEEEADTEADARAKMLIYLLENKLITL